MQNMNSVVYFLILPLSTWVNILQWSYYWKFIRKRGKISMINWKTSKYNIWTFLFPDKIRDYFGEGIAMYFSFLSFYTLLLMLPASLGLAQLLLDIDSFSEYTFYAVFNLIWVTVFLEVTETKHGGRAKATHSTGLGVLCGWLIYSFSSIIKIFLQYFSIEDTDFMNESFIKISRTCVKSQSDPGLEL